MFHTGSHVIHAVFFQFGHAITAFMAAASRKYDALLQSRATVYPIPAKVERLTTLHAKKVPQFIGLPHQRE